MTQNLIYAAKQTCVHYSNENRTPPSIHVHKSKAKVSVHGEPKEDTDTPGVLSSKQDSTAYHDKKIVPEKKRKNKNFQKVFFKAMGLFEDGGIKSSP
jgi:hypothetical protein